MMKSMLLIAAAALALLACGEKATEVESAGASDETTSKVEVQAPLPRALYYTISDA